MERHTVRASRMNDVSLRRVADEVEGIAGYKCQPWSGTLLQYADIGWLDDSEIVDDIDIFLSGSIQFDLLAGPYVLEWTEEAIPVTGNPNIAWRSRFSRSFDPAHCAIERRVVGPLQYGNLEVECGNLEKAKWRRKALRQALAVFKYPIL